MFSQGLFDLFLLRLRGLPIDFARNFLEIIEKFTHDEMRHTTQRMCLSSSCAHVFSDFQRLSPTFQFQRKVHVSALLHSIFSIPQSTKQQTHVDQTGEIFARFPTVSLLSRRRTEISSGEADLIPTFGTKTPQKCNVDPRRRARAILVFSMLLTNFLCRLLA